MVPMPEPADKSIIPPVWLNTPQESVPLELVPKRSSPEPVELIVNVPKQVRVAPLMLGIVVWPGVEQFQVKLLKV